MKQILLFLVTLCITSPEVIAQNIPVVQNGPAGAATFTIPTPPNVAIQSGVNVINTFVPVVPVSDVNSISSSSSISEVKHSQTYLDGFKKPILEVNINATRSNGSLKNILQPYDSRFAVNNVSYLPYYTEQYFSVASTFTHQKEHYNNLYPEELGIGYGTTKYESGADFRRMVNYAPGLSQLGQGRGTTITTTTNGTNEVRIWTVNSAGVPTSSAYYPSGSLKGQLIKDASGAEVLTYTTNSGRLVYKRVLLKNVVTPPDNVLAVHGVTYQIYDDRGRLRLIMPPRATEMASGGTISDDIRNSFCFQYRYNNSKGMLSAERKPGEDGYTSFVYDRKGRLIMTRTPLDSISGRWQVIYFDGLDRVKATSLYNNTQSASWWQNQIDNGTMGTTESDLLYFLMNPEAEDKYPSETAISGNIILSYLWYDKYDHADPNHSMGATFNTFVQPGDLVSQAETPEISLRTHGMVTGGRTRILPSPSASANLVGDWSSSVQYFDDKGRSIYSVKVDSGGGQRIHLNRQLAQFDFQGRVHLQKHEMQNLNSIDSLNTYVELTKNEYDAMTGQLKLVRHKVNGHSWEDLAHYQYDGLGRVRANILGNYGEVQHMNYNIRGQLAGINSIYAETGNNQGFNRSFGVSLKYDYGFTQPQHNGLITGIIWRGAGSAKPMAYGYNYDKSGRLTSADFTSYDSPNGPYFTSGWRNNLRDYSVENVGYDLNGNIVALKQKTVLPGSGIITLDDLTYSYENTNMSNRLQSVSDAAGVNSYGFNDFQDNHSGSVDYTYDVAGNLTADANKGITSITYNHLNKPVTITMSGGKSIEYSYDAAGNKLQELETDNSTTVRTDYIGNFVYRDDRAQYALTVNGRTVLSDSGSRKEEFFVKDHLGNVRSVIDVHTFPVQEFLGTYEIASAHIEGIYFDQHNEIRELNPSSTDPDNHHAGRLNAAESDRQTGTAMLVHVMAGDQIELNVNNFYEEYDPNNDHPITPSDIVDGLVTVLTRGDGGFSGSESSDKVLLGDVLAGLNPADLEDVLELSWDPNKPKAWLTYLLFDERMQIVPEGSKSFQVNGGGTWGQIGTDYPVIIPENGYLAVFLHTATVDAQCHYCGDVYFDQLLFRFTRGKLREETHYYPHGLPITTLSSLASGQKESIYKHQGNEFNKGLGLNWMNFHHRQYDPQIGRFLSVDPLAAATKSFSSYAAMNNNPASTVDPLGLTGIGIISWVGYAPTLMDHLLCMAPSAIMEMLGMVDDLSEHNEHMAAAAQGREQMRDYQQNQAVQAAEAATRFSFGTTNCNKLSFGGSSANEVYGFGGQQGEGGGEGDKETKGKDEGTPATTRALAIALTASSIDGPLPFGEAVGAAIIVGAVVYDNWDNIVDGVSSAGKSISNAWERMFSKEEKDHLKGGKQGQRDKDFGIKDKDFINWWHREGKREYGRDYPNRGIYDEWLELGKPRGPKPKK